MKTLLGTEISEDIRGILYLCEFDHCNLTIEVTSEILTSSAFYALEAYANIPNPESQLVTGTTYEELCERLEILHANMKNKEWLEELSNCL